MVEGQKSVPTLFRIVAGLGEKTVEKVLKDFGLTEKEIEVYVFLAKRGVQYEEINLAKDPEGRAELVRLTGMMTFPQVVIDGEPIGGYQELVGYDRSGRLREFAEAEAA